MVDGKHADVVVACLFAGVGAWGASVDVAPTYTYASELFGAGHDAIEYPGDARPMVTLTIPPNVLEDTSTEATELDNSGHMHNGEAVITFTLTAGVFDANIGGLMWDPDGPAPADPADCDGNALGCVEASSAPGTVASILEGGRKGQNFIKIKIEAANPDTDSAALDTDVTNDGGRRNVDVMQQLMFDIPELDELTHLAGAGDTADKLKKVELMAESRIVSGAFSDGALITNLKGDPSAKPVLYSQNAVSVSISGVDEHHIAIDDSKDGSMKAFHHLLGAKKGFVKLADVTIMSATKRVIAEEVKATDPMLMYTTRTGGTPQDPDADTGRIFSLAKKGRKADNDPILDLNGQEIDAGLRGTLTITAEGSRGLFNDGDMMFIDYDGNATEGDSERIDLDGDMGEGSALSIDPDKSESFSGGDVLSTGTFSVYYSAGGKDQMKHESMITVTASVDYSDPSATIEGAKSSHTTLRFAGVGSPVKAYAIPHSANQIGDKGNLRVRCEEAAGDDKACRVFLECWDQMGARGFGEAPMVGENMTAVWNGAAVEGVAEGLDEPTTRISCQVLSKGMVTVQQLTRDGNSQTLVNNTYVGGGM